ncbi:E3 ubiquitin-protein ligase TRIM69 isoform X3 [Monodelphis domestica]|uniref:E3 ubiquitin-protein ligase TRIM69 isoform X3 n=1 Tax=Monodelphis domestica TaxID=13616 RepID=UPI0004431119|nr:E3 ubiquitin-protein ligase TRIM69 isoform X3 [Monodelphis domestica]
MEKQKSDKTLTSSPKSSLNADAKEMGKINNTGTTCKANVDDLAKELHCQLCHDWFNKPVMLHCSHNFCKLCIEKAWKTNQKAVCPECFAPCPGRNYIPNLVLERLMLRIKDMPLLQGQPLCQEHGENLKLFSKQEGKLACFQCKDVRHSQEFLQINEAVHVYSRKLAISQAQVEASLKELQKLKGVQEEEICAHKDITAFLGSLEKGIEVLAPRHFISGQLSLGKFKGPIQYMTWKEMRSILTPDISLITLDPRTAHPNLVISEDQTSVWHGDIKQMIPDNPERFDSSVAVLGSEGFTSGKWYWEVEVAKKTKWTVGVVRESINRKGCCPLTPMDGFWLLRLRNQVELKALDVPSFSMVLKCKLNRVGIYLDYDGGQVSFYNAEELCHIYTFSSTFTEKIFPYFCPCLNDSGDNLEPLSIIHPMT